MKKILSCILFFVITIVGFAKIDFNTYHNPRFNFRVDVPTNFSISTSENGDGVTITDNEKEIEILAYGTNMILIEGEIEEPSLETLNKIYETKLNEHEKNINYKILKKDFFELSYIEDDHTIYEKVFYNKTIDSMCYYHAEYPSKYENEVKEIIKKMVDSFKNN